MADVYSPARASRVMTLCMRSTVASLPCVFTSAAHASGAEMHCITCLRASRSCSVHLEKLAVMLNSIASRSACRCSREVSGSSSVPSSTPVHCRSSMMYRMRSMCERFILPMTSSIVRSRVFVEMRSEIMMVEPSSHGSEMTSRPVSGAKRISFSVGNCETQTTEAPRSTMPILIWKSIEHLSELRETPRVAKSLATCQSVVVDMKPVSTPPMTPNSSGSRNEASRRQAGDHQEAKKRHMQEVNRRRAGGEQDAIRRSSGGHHAAKTRPSAGKKEAKRRHAGDKGDNQDADSKVSEVSKCVHHQAQRRMMAARRPRRHGRLWWASSACPA